VTKEALFEQGINFFNVKGNKNHQPGKVIL